MRIWGRKYDDGWFIRIGKFVLAWEHSHFVGLGERYGWTKVWNVGPLYLEWHREEDT